MGTHYPYTFYMGYESGYTGLRVCGGLVELDIGTITPSRLAW